MRTHVFTFTVFLLGLSILACGCSSHNSEIVYKAFYAASLYPEQFDTYVAIELSGSADEFLACATEVQIKLAEQFVKVTEHCAGLPPEYRRACRDVDEVKVALMIDAMAAVVRGEARYSDTMSGAGALMGKQLIGADQWVQLQKTVVPIFKSVLVCD